MRKGFDPDVQHARDVLALQGQPEFQRFLFTIAQRAGICSSAYGSNVDTSSIDGRRSLGIEILQMVDEQMPVRDEALAPFNALGLAIAAINRLDPQPTENDDEENTNDYEPRR